jgi:hypothetical protein
MQAARRVVGLAACFIATPPRLRFWNMVNMLCA